MGATFVGRSNELDAIATRFASGRRAVTLVGLGGIGKTRLAREHTARSPLPATFVDLGGARSAMDVTTSVAEKLGLGLAVDATLSSRVHALVRALSARGPTLLVLDEAEGVATELGALVDAFVDGASELLVLVTSRIRLGAASEHVIAVEPLAMGDDSVPSDAERMFEERARAAGATLTASDAPTIRAITRELEGIPLAIELTAARARLVPVAQLLERLRQGQSLGAVRETSERRHATMRDAVARSDELLTEEAREALFACACFRGGFGLASAEAILGAGAIERLQVLLDASLLRRIDDGGEARFDLFESVRAYALERASADPVRHRRRFERHAEHVAALVARAPLSTAIREHDNAVVALHRMLDTSPPNVTSARLALDLAVSLEPVRMLRGHAGTYATWLDAALAASDACGDASLRGAHLRALLARGRTATELGRTETARAAFEEALARATGGAHENDPAAEGYARCGLARLDATAGQWHRALEQLATAKLCAVRAKDEGLQHLALASASFYGSELHDSEEQLVPLEAAAAHFREAGDERASLVWTVQLGRAYTDFDRPERARVRLSDALARARAIGDRRAEGLASFGLGGLHLSCNELDEASRAYREAIDVLGEVGRARERGYALGYLGVTDHLRGAFDAAEASYREGMRVLLAADDAPNAALFSMFLAALDAERGHVDEGAAAFGRARAEVARFAGGGMREVVADLLASLVTSVRARAASNEADQLITLQRDAIALARVAEATPENIQSSRPRYDWRDVSLDVRVAYRLAKRALDAVPVPPDCVSVSEDASRIRTHRDAEWIELGARRVLRQLLAALVDARVASPSRSLTAAELVAAGWPGEKLDVKSASNRLHVALGTLRKLGLDTLIEHTASGWRLRPDVALVREASPRD